MIEEVGTEQAECSNLPENLSSLQLVKLILDNWLAMLDSQLPRRLAITWIVDPKPNTTAPFSAPGQDAVMPQGSLATVVETGDLFSYLIDLREVKRP